MPTTSQQWRRLVPVVLFLSAGCLHPATAVRPFAVTAPMRGTGDVADDVCVWRNSTRPERSLIIGVNKSDAREGGLYVFQLDGTRWGNADAWRPDVNWFDAGRKLNNVDAAHGFRAGAETWDLVCAANRTDRALDVFRVHTDSQGDFDRLELVARVPIGNGFAAGTDAPYGMALALAKEDPALCFAFTSDKQGRAAQYELRFNSNGAPARQLAARRLDAQGRPWQISERGCEIEGIVADAERGVVYLGSEDEGIFRYRLRDGVLDPASKVVVDRVGPRVTADVEGLTLYRAAAGQGWLIASSQGSSQFAVYRRDFDLGAPNRYVTNFSIHAAAGLDAVQETDGIDAVSGDFGGRLDEGLFIAHDAVGSDPTNYKLVTWSAIASIIASPGLGGGYDIRAISGWTVHISRDLLATNAAATRTAVELLTAQLARIASVVPKAALVRLQEVPLWISPDYPDTPPRAEYHPDAGWLRDHGRDPAMARAVEFTNVRIFPAETRRMPVFALHELAHAYHHRVLGFDEPRLRAAYRKARAGGSYDRVERRDAEGRVKIDRAYAMTDAKEYFAESSEAFFGTNDFFPFTRDELKTHDPEMFRLLVEIWERP